MGKPYKRCTRTDTHCDGTGPLRIMTVNVYRREVELIDQWVHDGHVMSRSEFMRQAIREKIQRESNWLETDLLTIQHIGIDPLIPKPTKEKGVWDNTAEPDYLPPKLPPIESVVVNGKVYKIPEAPQ